MGTGSGATTGNGARGGSGTTGAASPSSTGTGRGDSSGAGTSGVPGASAPNTFPGITILGGGTLVENGRPAAAANAPRNPAPISTSYGLTVLSTGASGGGLPQFGVFSNAEQVHTVYLDMRRSMFDTSPSWTFQYALLNPPSDLDAARPNQQGLVLPFPMAKEQPAVPADVVRKNVNKMVIVYAIVSATGKLEQLEVKQSPDALLNAPVLAALGKWSFKPAQFNGGYVAVKVLLGIPLSQ